MYDKCHTGAIAYTKADMDTQVYCEPFFTATPAVNNFCHQHSQGTVVIHEMTHLLSVKGTLDFRDQDGNGGYGYEFVRVLPADLNVWHADTYACMYSTCFLVKAFLTSNVILVFAQSINVGC
jgi:hypothetical protein